MKKALLITLLVIFSIFLINTFHEEYPDEYDSIVGGKFITQGKVPYRDWFQHHQPGAYVLSALILPFTGINFVKFRVILAAVFFLINVAGYFVLRKRLAESKINLNYYLIFLFFIAIAGTFFWWQMLLADTLAAYLLIPAYTLVLLKLVLHEKFDAKDLFIVNLFTFFAWWTSMTYIYLVIGINLFAVYLFHRSSKNHAPFSRNILTIAKMMLPPYIIFFIFLLITGSLKDYYFAAITYNQNYYIYNAAHEIGKAVNPMRYAITIAMTFFNNIFSAFGFLKDFNPSNSIIPLLTASNLAIIVFLIISRHFTAAIFVIFSLIFASARSNPSAVRETDYQSSVYTMFAFFNGVTAVYFLRNFINRVENHLSEKIIAAGMLMLLLIHSLFAYSYLSLNFMQKFYKKYMGEAPLIYNRPQIASIVNMITSKNDYAWVGPFEFKEIFYIQNAKMPSRYHWFLQHAATSKIKDEMIADFKKNRSKVIVFQRDYTPWGGVAHDFNYFFTDYLDKYYFRLPDLNKADKKYEYKWRTGDTINFNLSQSFNFDKSRKEEILNQLIALGLIEKTLK
jgi:hypothetical protein